MPRRLCSSRDVAERLCGELEWADRRGLRYVEAWLDKAQDLGGIIVGDEEQLGVFVPMRSPVHDMEGLWDYVHPDGKYLFLPFFVSEKGRISRDDYRRYVELEFPKACRLYFRREKYDEKRELRF